MKAAELLALDDCKSKGGTNCTVAISYGNGCVAMVFGDSLLTTGSGGTKEEAENKATHSCSSGDTNCRVYYSACSLPVQRP